MRKLFALLFVAGTLAFASCSEKKAEEAATTETVDTAAHVEEAPVAPVDTTAAAPADTTAAAPAEAPAAH
ncbi:MAG: hypothetical protein J7604_17170 [Sporocytophaga sp.]|uniref:hypothetical protein n=1 Tax=Sporocytophaga sp. TaxID=2231183 RepID=UPI001B0342CA|nr:hypothetical protein [Sporocytophaga sp.]MBO9701942.1 hypothetical protein [Sporocytophaga sp.]